MDIKNVKWKTPQEIFSGISDGNLEWPVLEVKFKKINGLRDTVVCQYFGDYELAGGFDVLGPIIKLEKKGYKYFIFDFTNTVCVDHFLGIPQIIHCHKKARIINLKYLIICPNWFKDYLELIGFFPQLGKENFVSNLKDAVKKIRNLI